MVLVLAFVASTPLRAGETFEGKTIHRNAPPPRSRSPFVTSSIEATAYGGYTPYHTGPTLLCTDCHSVHASQEHGFDGDPTGYPYVEPPHNKLLRKADPVDVCLACHDGRTGVPDVVGFDTNSLVQRSGGHMDLPDVPNFRGHNLGRGLRSETACQRCHFGGEMATASVSCIDCHNPHGNNKARNLQWVSSPGGEPDFGLLMSPGATGLQKYERANVAYTYVNSAVREVSNMCIDCHHSFFDSSSHYFTKPGGMTHWGRHPGFNSEWGALDTISTGGPTGSSNPAHWEGGSGSGFDGAARVPFVAIGATDFSSAMVVNASSNAVFCLSCHKAHGGDHAFGLTWEPITTPRPKGCDQCHGVAGP